jgi:ureidoglycolate hydrolase
MTEIVDVVLEPLTAEAFAPYGRPIDKGDGPPDFEGPHIASWRMDFAVDGEIELMYVRYFHQDMRWTTMERHFNVTQSFLALGGAASVMVVADPTDTNDRSVRPRPETVCAFLVDGIQGVMLWKGTWHALTRFPVSATGAAFAMITGAATQQELERQSHDGTQPELTQVVDFEKEYGVGFAVVDPRGLLAAYDNPGQ